MRLQNREMRAAKWADIQPRREECITTRANSGTSAMRLNLTSNSPAGLAPAASSALCNLRPVRGSASVLAACGLAAAAMAMATPAIAQLNYQTVLTTGTQAAGAPSGVRFSQLTAPSVTANGMITMRGTLTGSGVTSTNNMAIFSGETTGGTTMRMLARLGARPASLPSGTRLSLLDQPAISSSGETVYAATIAGTGVATLNNRLVFASNPTGTRLLARTGGAAIGMPAGITLSDVQQPQVSPTGHVSFQSTFAGTGMWNGSNRGLYVVAPGSSTPTLEVRQGGQVAGMPAGVNWASFSAPVLNSEGRLLLLGFMSGPGVSSANDAVIYSSAGQILARKGTGFGAGDLTLRSFSNPSVSGDRVGFMAMINDPSTIFPRGAAFVATSGVITNIARSGLAGIDMASGVTYQLFGQPTVGGSGHAFLATVAGTGVVSSNGNATDVALFAGDSTGSTQVARLGGSIPGSPAAHFDLFDQPAIGPGGHIVFTARLRGEGVTSANNRGLFAYNARAGLQLIARTGRSVMVGTTPRMPVEIAIAAGSGGDARPACMTTGGQMLFLLRTADSSTIVRVQLPSRLADLSDATGRGSDGSVDQRDLAAFMNAFASGSMLADVTGEMSSLRDGRVTAADMTAFMASYQSASATSGQ